MFPRLIRRPPASRIASRTKRNLGLESLEGRQMMSLSAEFAVSVPTVAAQVQSANATSTNGSSVAVWTDFSHGNARISGQRFNSQGGKVGGVMNLASGNGMYDEQPSVAMDAHGNFVVSWTQFDSTGHTDILAQKFNSSGNTIGGVVPVAVGTFAQTNSSVGMDANGDFVVSYTRNTNNNNPDIFAKLYNTNDQLLNVVTVAGTSHAETLSSVAMTPDGRFDVTYQYQFSSTDTDIYAARYTASGSLIQLSAIATSTALEESPKIAIDNHGNAVVAYEKWNGSNWDVMARRLSNTGAMSSQFTVAGTSANETFASVALEGNAGAFVVAYDSNTSVAVSEVNSSNVVFATYNLGSSRFEPAISINPQNDFLVTYSQDIGNDMLIAGRRGLL